MLRHKNNIALGVCPRGWSYYKTRCYKLTSGRMFWNAAQAECVAEGGHLAWPTDEAEQDYLLREY